jgi:O-antigen ligase
VRRLPDKAAATFEAHGWVAISVLLAWTIAVGGSSRGNPPGEVIAQLMALPLIGWAALALAQAGARGRNLPRAPLLLALSIVALPALQQVAIPQAWWTWPVARDDLSRDLAAAGVSVQPRWSLSPLASERALWSLLPALAVFLGTLAIHRHHLRRLLLLVVAAGFASFLFGGLQMLLPRQSVLNPFPQWAPAFNGVFENPNHQASLMALCATIVAALPWRSHDGSGRLRRSAPAWLAIGVALLVSVPLTGSRAGMGLAIIGVVAAVAAGYWQPAARPRAARRMAPAAILACVLLLAAGAWLQPKIAGSVRWSLIEATATMARHHAPLGAGAGTFTRWFDQSAPDALVQWEYFNHAHDEYVQWWFELGVAGVACVLAVFAVMLVYSPLRRGIDGAAPGAALAGWLGCVLLLLHSLVDYPLRTPALMAVAALLAGAMCAGRRPPRNTMTEESDER